MAQLTFTSCGPDGVICLRGKGAYEKKQFPLENFNGVDLKVSGDVFITQGAEFKVEIEAEESIMEELDVHVNDAILVIDNDRCFWKHRSINIYVTMPDVNTLSLSGSGSIQSQNTLVSDELVASISGSGDMNLGVEANHVSSQISGSGDIFLEGKTDTYNIKISGSGDIDAFDFESYICNITISGSGDCRVNVNDDLNVRISGSGDVYYKGTPEIEKNISGSGKIINSN